MRATKSGVKQAVERLLGSKVASVRTAIIHGKIKRQGRFVWAAAGLEKGLRATA